MKPRWSRNSARVEQLPMARSGVCVGGESDSNGGLKTERSHAGLGQLGHHLDAIAAHEVPSLPEPGRARSIDAFRLALCRC